MVASAARPLPVKARSRSLGLSLGTTYNIVRTLVHDGYLVFEYDGVVLGPSVLSLGSAGEQGFEFARIRSALRRLADESGATAYMCQYLDGEVHIVDFVESSRVPPPELWVGVSESAHATAFGKQILTELSAAERLDYLSRHSLASLTPYTIRDRNMLMKQLDHVGDVTVEREEYALGYACVAAPVRAPDVVGALALALPSVERKASMAVKVEALRKQAAKIALHLGAGRFGQFSS